MVKLDAGVSGDGNAFVDLHRLAAPRRAHGARARIGERVDEMRLQAAGVSLSDFLARLERGGGVVEERIVGRQLRSPSVQLELAGRPRHGSCRPTTRSSTGDGYMGCRFPAEPAYAGAITETPPAASAHHAEAGTLGRAAIDFVVTRERCRQRGARTRSS